MDTRISQLGVALTLAALVALPFVFRRDDRASGCRRRAEAPKVLVIITPHNAAIRHEFGRGFSAWHAQHYGDPVTVDWRVIGGTSDIMRYLRGAMTQAFRAWWTQQGHAWPAGGAEMIFDRRFDATRPPPDAADRARWERQRALWTAWRATDDATAFSSRIDLFFGGGVYDHDLAAREGLTVAPWDADHVPAGLFYDSEGRELIPHDVSGETWRGATFFGTCLSSFGIVYNPDRVSALNLAPPRRWRDLADIRYAGLLGVADPTKSGSVAKAFEMIIHEQCRDAVREAGFDAEACRAYERLLAGRAPDAPWPDAVPRAYQEAIEEGWRRGLFLIQKIGANARYFTDAAGRVPVDVSMGNAAAGIAIDFFGRFQSEYSIGPDGRRTLEYVTPKGGSSISADPIALLRGAPERELAVRFIQYVLSEDGQKLWAYRPGTPGGPSRYALRRLPVRRDFYPGSWPDPNAARHLAWTVDALDDPRVDPYALAEEFEYFPRWTARHFNAQRYLVRAMCMDAGAELRALWLALRRAGGPAAYPGVVAMMEALPDRPEPVTWSTAPDLARRKDRLGLLNEWTKFYRMRYRAAQRFLETGTAGD